MQAENTNRDASDLRAVAESAIADLVRRVEHTGELQHLHGRPLDLSDDSPTWFINKTLRREGFSHPVLELGKELDAALATRHRETDRLQRHRDWLTRSGEELTKQQATDFNAMRAYVLDGYRERLIDLNRAIRDHNIGTPGLLHRLPFVVDEEVEWMARRIPPLAPPEERRSRRTWLQRLLWGNQRG